MLQPESDTSPVEVVVAGGGIVGLSTARALQERGVRRLAVLEAEPELARHQTGRNSGVIHSGLYYRPGSLKARACARGREAMYRFCREAGVRHRRTGKLVVATRPDELPRLDELERRGRANGLVDMERLDEAALRHRAPGVAGIRGLRVRETGLTDFAEVARALARRVRDTGGRIRTGARVVDVAPDGRRLRVVTEEGETVARHLVGCAGLHADRLARACGLDPGLRIVPFRGEYYAVDDPPDTLREIPVYPVPDPALPFLGVHFTPDLDGRVEAGPNAVLALSREGYQAGDVDLGDVAEIASFPGFWRMAAQHWRSGLAEATRSVSAALFARSARRLAPGLTANRFRKNRAGVRAQAVDARGNLVDDFRIAGDGRTLHVLNAPSPAATASLAIGREVARRAADAWDLGTG